MGVRDARTSVKMIFSSHYRAIRLRKLIFALTHPCCWPALSRGVFPASEQLPVLRNLSVDGVIDVGANRGQFTFACRLAYGQIPIVAFEPVPNEARIFHSVHGRHKFVQLVECALGDITGVGTLHVSKSADNSSLLPIALLNTKLFRNTEEVGTIKVSVSRLDDYSDLWKYRKQQLLKLDVQGFELNVLRGASETLHRCAYVYAECSEVALYDGQALRGDVEAYLKQHGFSVRAQFNDQYADGKLIQADYLFSR